ncbi:MAG: DUF1572 family protein [Acidobacteriota bacterium]
MTGAPDGYLAYALRRLKRHRTLVEDALAQVSDADFFSTLDPESNSIAIVVKHLAGNMRSRFTDFLVSDGEKPDRARDGEFVTAGESRGDVMRLWESAWAAALPALEALTAEDLDRTVTIRGQPHRVYGAVNRHLMHFAYHAGQIVFLAKHFAGPAWKTLSVPRGGSEDFDAAMKRRAEERR